MLLRARSWTWQTIDVSDDDEPASKSRQQNKISYKSPRKALRGRHPIPPLPFCNRLPGRKRDWEGKKEKESETRGGAGGKQVKINACRSISTKQREGESVRVQGLSPLSPFALLAMYCLFTAASPCGVGGKWAFNWVSIHHLLTLMCVVLEWLHLMFLFQINYLQSI